VKQTSEKTVRVKFNFSQSNPDYDFQKAINIAIKEKSLAAYNLQRQIDFSTLTNIPDTGIKLSVYKAGQIYDIPEQLYEKLSKKIIRTYNPAFGSFREASLGPNMSIKKLEYPVVTKVDDNGLAENPYLDMHRAPRR
jgi:hypothetical protein